MAASEAKLAPQQEKLRTQEAAIAGLEETARRLTRELDEAKSTGGQERQAERAQLASAREQLALVQGAAEPDAAKQLVRFFTSPAVADIVRGTGLDPASK